MYCVLFSTDISRNFPIISHSLEQLLESKVGTREHYHAHHPFTQSLLTAMKYEDSLDTVCLLALGEEEDILKSKLVSVCPIDVVYRKGKIFVIEKVS